MKKNRIKIYLLVLTIFTYSLNYSQKTIELIPFDCEQENLSFLTLNKDELFINGVNKNSTSNDPYRLLYRIDSDTIRIKYKSIYNQNLDTIFFLKYNYQELFLCVDKFKSYDQTTLIEKAIETKNNWELIMSRLHCEGGLEEFSLCVKKRGKKYLAKYKFWKYVEKKNNRIRYKKKRFTHKKEIDEKQINRIIEFEKKLKLMNRDKGNCTTQTSYYVTNGKDSISINEPNCLFYGEIELLKDLGFKDELKINNE